MPTTPTIHVWTFWSSIVLVWKLACCVADLRGCLSDCLCVKLLVDLMCPVCWFEAIGRIKVGACSHCLAGQIVHSVRLWSVCADCILVAVAFGVSSLGCLFWSLGKIIGGACFSSLASQIELHLQDVIVA